MPSLLNAYRLLAVALVVVALAGMAALWPGHVSHAFAQVGNVDARATVTGIVDRPCGAIVATRCIRVRIHLDSGDAAGTVGYIRWNANGQDPPVHEGDHLRVVSAPQPEGYDQEPVSFYDVTDYGRSGSLTALFAAFALVALAVLGVRGLRMLAGLAASLAVALLFVVPAILNGKPAVAVVVVGSLAAVLATVALAHGTGPRALAALLGASATLALTVALAVLVVHRTRLTGLGTDEMAQARTLDPTVSLEGLLIAAVLVAAIGVLVHVAVHQSSLVFGLSATHRDLGWRQLFGRAVRAGREHAGSSVNLLVLAYAGAMLPLLLILGARSLPLGEALGLERISEPLIAVLVSSIGLLVAVPVTTLVASLLATRLPRDQLDAAAGHARDRSAQLRP